MLLSFSASNDTDTAVVTIHHMTDGIVGWTSDGKVAVVANNLSYRGVSSEYAPSGTMESEVKFVPCSRDEMDCSSLESRIAKGAWAKHIAGFPES